MTSALSATMLGIYPVGGRFSNPADNAAQRLEGRPANATGAVPERMLTYVDRLYLEAELMHVGGTPDAALLETALVQSFGQVNYAIQNARHSTQPVAVVPLLTRVANNAVDTYITSIMNRYAAADAEGKFEILMTQKWISSFGSAINQYNDYRRTGYPVLHDPNTDGSNNTQRLRNYAVSFPWSNEELTLNPNSPAAQKDPQTFKVFWDVD
jgi:hypothetical protein